MADKGEQSGKIIMTALSEPREPSINTRLAFSSTIVLVGTALTWALVFLTLNTTLTRGFILQLIFVTVFSSLVAFVELLSRYNDNPARLLAGVPTAIYLLINIAAGVGALSLIKVTDPLEKSGQLKPIYEAMIAGFGATLFFRSALFTTRVGNESIDVRPSAISSPF
jgi:hypothetical protein